MKSALIYNFNESTWKSCQSISKNLFKSYKSFLNRDDLFTYDYNYEMSDFQIFNIASSIKSSNIKRMIIIDHTPHPLKLLIALDKLKYFDDKKKEIIIHVFGDFTLFSSSWEKAQTILKKTYVKLICASEKQSLLIKSFLNDAASVFTMPFPVDTQFFNFDKKVSLHLKQIINLNKEKIIFSYAGRLSSQKKIIELINCYETYVNLNEKDSVLLLAGKFDGIGSPFIGDIYECERYECDCIELISNFNKSYEHAKIIYVSNLAQDELKNFKLVTDIFISLSVHNDEDFGMSPAEALSTGLPAILTDWAGYSSFATIGSQISLINVQLTDSSIVFDKTDVVTEMLKMSDEINILRSKRMEFARSAHDYLSIKTGTENIQNILNTPRKRFEGFNLKFRKLTSCFGKNAPPFGDIKVEYTYNNLYQEIYGHYF